MSDKTGIEWTDSTWNPVWGCTPVSPGCDHCYAETLVNGRLAHLHPGGFATVRLRPEQLDKPLHWKRPRRIFVNSMSDLFHDDIPDEYIANVFAVMALAPQHTFQILTKRHGRMRSLLKGDLYALIAKHLADTDYLPQAAGRKIAWPLPNVWLGVSVENQQWADIRIPALLDTPAAVRFLSCEPLLGPVSLDAYLRPAHCEECSWTSPHQRQPVGAELLHWVIVGGESGRGARPMRPEWARWLRDQCTASGVEVAFLFKQWGEYGPANATDGADQMIRLGKKAAGRELDSRTWDEYPEATHV